MNEYIYILSFVLFFLGAIQYCKIFIMQGLQNKKIVKLITFTFMHLADAFIQSDLHCIQVTVSTLYQLLLSLGIEPIILALLAPCSTS